MAVDLGTAVGKIVIDSSGAVRGVSQAEAVMGRLSGAAKVAGVAVAAGVAAAGAALVKLGVEAGTAAADMDQAMANIAAIMSKSREEIAPLGELIQGLAVNPNLKVSATEAADAVAMLARNGLDMSAIMSGAAEATVFLANAAGGTFAQSADIMTDSMAIFGIEAKNAMDAVNGITSVTTSSKFSIDDYALALAQGGGAAAAAGVEFADFNAAISAISPLFGSGADAGTSFKVMMQRLIPASNTARDAMMELGIITEDGANKFFDANGNLQSMTEIVGVLESAFGGLTEQQKNQALTTIFGTDAMRAAVGLMDTGKVSFGELMNTMAQTDAMESATTRMDTLHGTLDILKGLVEGFTLQIGNALLPLLRSFADSMLALAESATPVVDSFTNMIAKIVSGHDAFESFQTFVVQVGESLGLTREEAVNLAARLGDLKRAVETVVDFISSAISVVNSIVEKLGGWETVIIAVVAALGTLTVITTIVGWITSLIAIVGSMSAAFTAAGTVVGGIVAILGGPLTLAIAAIAALVAGFVLAWRNDWLGIQTATIAAKESIVNALSSIDIWIKTKLLPVLESLYNKWTGVWWPSIAAAVEAARNKISSSVSTIVAKIGVATTKATALYNALKGFYNWLKNKVFSFKIDLPKLPAWATPGSPIPLHTRWEEFGDYLKKNTFRFNADFSGFQFPGANGEGGGSLSGFSAQVDMLISQMSVISDNYNKKMLERVQSLVETSGKIAELIPQIFAAIHAINKQESGAMTVSVQKLGELNHAWYQIFDHLAVIAWLMKTSLDRMEGFVDTSLKIAELVPKMVEAIMALHDLQQAGDVRPAIERFVSDLQQIMTALVEAADLFSVQLLGHLQLFAETAGKVFDLVGKAVGGIAALSQFEAVNNVPHVIMKFGSDIALIVDTIKNFAVNFDSEGFPHLVAFSETAGKVIDFVKKAVDGILALANFDATNNIPHVMMKFGSDVALIVDTIKNFATNFDAEGFPHLVAFSETAGKVVGLIKPALDGIMALAGFEAANNVPHVMMKFGSDVAHIVATIRDFAVNFDAEGFPHLQMFADTAGKVLGVVKTAVDALSAIGEFVAVADLRTRINAFVSQTMAAVNALVVGISNISNMTKKNLEAAAGMTADIGNVLGVIKNGVNALAAIGEFVGVTELASKLDIFTAQLAATVVALKDALNKSLGGMEEGLTSAGTLSNKSKEVLDTVKRGVDSLLALSEFVGVQNLQETVTLFASQLVQTVVGLTSALNDGLAGMEESLSSAGGLSGLAKDVLETVKRGVDSIAALTDFTGVVGLSEKLSVFSQQLVSTVVSVADALNSGLAGMEEALASAGLLSGLANDVLETVKRGVDSIAALGEFESLENAKQTTIQFASDLVAVVTELVYKLNVAAANLPSQTIDTAAAFAQRAAELVAYVSDVVKSLKQIVEGESVEVEAIRNAMANIAEAVNIAIQRANALVTGDGANGLVNVFNQILVAINAFVPIANVAGWNVGTSIVNGIISAILAGQGSVQAAINTVVASGGGGAGGTGGGAPAGATTTNNTTTTNFFGGQTFTGGNSSNDAFAQLGLVR